ncbi:MAG: rhodanese-like domain-containing protein [Gemmataceae bacterium]
MIVQRVGLSAVTIGLVAGLGLAADHTKDTTEQVKKAVEEGKAVLIDVREADEWKEGHIIGAKHLALSDLKTGISKEKLKELLPEGKIVYLHCAAGGRCLKAADLLKTAGFETRPLKPGYQALLKAGFDKAK